MQCALYSATLGGIDRARCVSRRLPRSRAFPPFLPIISTKLHQLHDDFINACEYLYIFIPPMVDARDRYIYNCGSPSVRVRMTYRSGNVFHLIFSFGVAIEWFHFFCVYLLRACWYIRTNYPSIRVWSVSRTLRKERFHLSLGTIYTQHHECPSKVGVNFWDGFPIAPDMMCIGWVACFCMMPSEHLWS